MRLDGIVGLHTMRLWVSAPAVLLINGVVEIDMQPRQPYQLTGTERNVAAFGREPFVLALCFAGEWPDGQAPYMLALPAIGGP
jgi:hypothetical protein